MRETQRLQMRQWWEKGGLYDLQREQQVGRELEKVSSGSAWMGTVPGSVRLVCDEKANEVTRSEEQVAIEVLVMGLATLGTEVSAPFSSHLGVGR